MLFTRTISTLQTTQAVSYQDVLVGAGDQALGGQGMERAMTNGLSWANGNTKETHIMGLFAEGRVNLGFAPVDTDDRLLDGASRPCVDTKPVCFGLIRPDKRLE